MQKAVQLQTCNACLIGHKSHSLSKATGGNGLVQHLVLRCDVGNHDGAAVAPQAIPQDHCHGAVAVWHMSPQPPSACLLQFCICPFSAWQLMTPWVLEALA